jgi:hypothetical protein
MTDSTQQKKRHTLPDTIERAPLLYMGAALALSLPLAGVALWLNLSGMLVLLLMACLTGGGLALGVRRRFQYADAHGSEALRTAVRAIFWGGLVYFLAAFGSFILLTLALVYVQSGLLNRPLDNPDLISSALLIGFLFVAERIGQTGQQAVYEHYNYLPGTETGEKPKRKAKPKPHPDDRSDTVDTVDTPAEILHDENSDTLTDKKG